MNSIDELKSFINDENIKVYINEEGKTVVEGNILVLPEYSFGYTTLPVKIDILKGSIHWYGGIMQLGVPGTLTSLENFPDEVDGDVIIFKNPNLTSLKGCPKHITGTLQCDHCNISDISDIATYIGRNCILNNNPITDATPLTKCTVEGTIQLVNTPAGKDLEQLKVICDTSVVIVQEDTTIQYN